jgi:hypothetical protein
LSRDAQVSIRVVLERKHAELAAFVVVPAAKVAQWKLSATTTVDATLDGVSLGRRSLQRFDDDRWFVELRRDQLAALGKSVGERATLVIAVASSRLPAELQSVLDTVPSARARWRTLTDAQKRMLREEILAAKTSATRERRARKALLPQAKPSARVEGLTTTPRTLLVRIVARRLPGRDCGPYREVTVGMAHKVGCDPEGGVPADRRTVTWETRVEVRGPNGVPAFRGRAVNGPPRARFLYLTWIGRKGRAGPAMFRRAKLRLDAVPAEVLALALRSGVLVGTLGLTACDGMPVCASVRPPQIAWHG